MNVKRMLRDFLGMSGTPRMPNLSVAETYLVSSYVRREFPPEEWTRTTQSVLGMIAQIECELPFHFVTNGLETKYQIFVPRDSEKFQREGYKIGRLLETLFTNRGYSVYSMGEQKPVDSPEARKYGTGWGWNVFVSLPR